MLTFFLNLFRFRSVFINAFYSSFYGSRMFYGVQLRSGKNLQISSKADIEKGSCILASDPSNPNNKNIIIEDHCWIGRNVEIQTHYDSVIEIKEYASIQDRCKLLGAVSIGKYSILAPDIFISSGNHNYKSAPHLTIREQDKVYSGSSTAFNSINKPVVVEEDCWIGKNVFIKQGIYIGRGAIIGTNAIVRKDIEPYTIHAGSPTEKIKDRFTFDPPQEISPFVQEQLPYFYKGFEHFNPMKSTVECIKDNEGIAGENSAFVVLKNTDWNNIQIDGHARVDGELKIYVNGIHHQTVGILNGASFQVPLKSISFTDIKEQIAIPQLLQKYLCIQFEIVASKSNQKYNFIISKIQTS